MLGKSLSGLALAVTLISAATAQDSATAVVSRASKAIGADTLNTVQYSATGHDFALGQAANPSLPWPKFIDKSYTRSIDFRAPASRVDRVRLQGENPPRGGGGQPLVGEQSQSQTIIVDAGTPWAQQLDIWITPHGFLRAAATRNATVEARTIRGKKYNVVTFTGGNNAKVNGYINDQNLIERVETWVDNPVLGDTPLEALYSGYKDFGGAQFPTHIQQIQGGYPVLDLNVSDVKVNAPVSIQPAQGAGAATAGAPANPPVQVEKLSEGVYLFTGGYSVIAVDFKDHITLFESGQNEARGLAVIAEAKKLIPGKPVKYVVNTHSHFDHSGGLRAFVAEGTTIVTHKGNKKYLQTVLAQPHTLNPDKAQEAGKKPIVEGVGDKTVLTDGTHVVELYRLDKFAHHDGMLVAYFPKEKVLFEADAYNPQPLTATPPSPASVVNLSLVENIKRLKLDVERIIPVHYPADNRVITLSELNRWTGTSGS